MSILALVYLLTDTRLIATPVIVSVLVLLQVYSLLKYVQKTNREIARFFGAIRYSDFSQNFQTTTKGTAFEELDGAFTEVIEEFRKARMEKEEQHRYLQTVVQHVGIGLLAFTPDGNVELLNSAAKRLLRVNSLKNISDLNKVSRPLLDALQKIRSGEKILVKFADATELSQLSISSTEFKLRENHYTLVSLSNIRSELEEREMEAWQNLIRVLTHEIMNSVTPIISLASTASSLLGEYEESVAEGGKQGGTGLDDVKGALHTITKRSSGLLRFVDDYRNLARIPTPNFQTVQVADLFDRVYALLAEQITGKQVRFSRTIEPQDLEITADPDLIEQVLINLLLNSLAAVSATPEPAITLGAGIDNRSRVRISVSDNGHGVPNDLLEKIFIPFFTTKKDGSGIGLSLSRQILTLHHAAISVHSDPDFETVFTIRF